MIIVKNETKLIRYVTAACFLVWAILDLRSFFLVYRSISSAQQGYIHPTQYIYFLQNFLPVIAWGLLCACLLARTSALGITGAIINTASCALYVFYTVYMILNTIGYRQSISAWQIVSIVLNLVCAVFLLLVTLNGKHRVPFAITAASIRTLSLMLVLIRGSRLSWIGWIKWLVGIAAMALFGFAYAAIPKAKKAKKPVPQAAQASAEDKIERIEKIKHLQELGIISEEEFNEKKKQILDL